ncbi:MAG: triose-phosphate isomerase [Candidatus Woesearchaeota archaeon]
MKLKTPVIIINFKTYKSATGKNALNLAKICEKVAKKNKANIAVAVQDADIYRVSSNVKIPVLAQHIDDINFGSHTGATLAEDVRQNGAVGTLLNHSEKRIPKKTIGRCIKRAKKNRLITIVCAPSASVGKSLFSFNPDFIAVEPPKLIGGKISVSTAKPEIITKSVHSICGRKIHLCKNLIVGAGVHTTQDVKIALELGSVGVLVASGITKAKNPEKALADLVKGLKR